MSTVLKSLATNLLNMAKDAVKIRAIDKEDLRNLLKSNSQRHSAIVKLFRSFSSKELQEMFSRYSIMMKNNKKLISADVYNVYFKNLSGKAKSDESRFFLNAIMEANAEYSDILLKIEKDLDKLIEQKELTLVNVRMTSISVLGIIRQSNVVLNWTMFMWSQFIKTVSGGNVNEIPLYRCKYLMDKAILVADTVSYIRDRKGPYMFLEEAKQLKQKNADLILNATSSSVNFLSMLNPSNYTKGFLDNLSTLLSVLNIFRWSQEMYDDWKHKNYLADKEMLSWMEQHSSMLRYELDGMNKDDPKYRMMLQVIDAYDSRISDYHRKIEEYETTS